MTLATRTLLASSVLLALSTPAVASFDETVFFGDSLTDSGYFGAKFTTNPDKVWAEHLADAYGTDGSSIRTNGTNYAVGGALAVTDTTSNNMLVPSAKIQINNYLTSHSINPNALYSVWVGANDLLPLASNPAAAPTVIFTTAQNTASTVASLHEAGAKYILVPNLPDIGLTPLAIDSGQTAAFTAIAQNYNQLLNNNLTATGANVILLDTFGLLQTIAANPTAYGFSNTQNVACTTTSSLACTPNTLVEANANQSYLFADGIHPTGATHAILAQYAKSVLDTPLYMGRAGQSVHEAGFGTQKALSRHVDLLAKPDGKYSTVWANATLAQSTATAADDSISPTFMLGVDFGNALSLQSTTGLYVQGGEHKVEFGDNADFTSKQLGLGVYHKQHYTNGLWAMLQLAGSRLDTDSTRHISLGNATHTHQAEGKGRQLAISASIGKDWQKDALTLTPRIGIKAVNTSLTSLDENGNTATALSISRQNYSDTDASIGIQGKYSLNPALSLFGQVDYTHRLTDNDHPTIHAKLRGQNTREFTLPLSAVDSDGVDVAIGVQGVAMGLTGAVGITHSTSDLGGTGAFLEIGKRF